jgi:adenosylcobyric acid synthase
MSNYNDFEPLIADDDICLEFISSNISLDKFDLVILPGSKLVIKDLIWLKETRLFEQLKQRKKDIFGICGGYQMMFKNIIDNLCIETLDPTTIEALGFIDDDIVFQKEKILKKDGELFEIHHGISKRYPIEFEKDNTKGTFSHGIFNDKKFSTYKKETIEKFVNTMKEKLDIKRILNSVS